MPRRTPGCRRYRAYGRVFDVAITRPQARAIVLSGEDTLEERLQEAGVERWPVTGEVHLYESMLGTQPGHLTAFEDETAPVGADELEELTPGGGGGADRPARARAALPGVGPTDGAGAAASSGWSCPGRVVRRRRPRLLVRVDAARHSACDPAAPAPG